MVAPTRGPKGDSKVEVEPHSKAVVEPHKHRGVFIAKGEDVKDDVLFTMNLVPGEAVYNECRISVQNEDGTEIEYRVWDSFRCKLAAAIRVGMRDICIKPGAHVLYLCAASAITVSHVSDIVGPEGMVYAVESSDRIGSDLVSMTEKRTNVLLITGDARNPAKYRMHVGIVDVIFFDVAQPDQARTLAQLVSHFLKAGGHFVMSVKANCSDLMASGESEFMDEVIKLRAEGLTPVEGFDVCALRKMCPYAEYVERMKDYAAQALEQYNKRNNGEHEYFQVEVAKRRCGFLYFPRALPRVKGRFVDVKSQH